VTTYGSARRAEAGEIRMAGLLHPDAVLLGRWRSAYFRHQGQEHVLCFAPTRSSKGVGLVVPTLAHLAGAGDRSRHQRRELGVDGRLASAVRPGAAVRSDQSAERGLQSAARGPPRELEVRDVQNIADVLVDPEGALEKRNHWEKTSHSLLVGPILHVLYAEEDKTLAGVASFLSDPKRPIETTLRTMMTTPHLGQKGVHPVVPGAARELLNKSENERSGCCRRPCRFWASIGTRSSPPSRSAATGASAISSRPSAP
jgi:type IV secretion system protein VirD4